MPRYIACFLASVLFATGLPVIAAQAGDESPVTITNSGSTNMSGFTLDVRPDGTASWQSGEETKTGALPPDLVAKLFGDVRAAQPLDALAAGGCAKSASFGTVTRISADTKTSPDISCGGDDRTQALYADAQAAEKALDISPAPRRRAAPQPANP